MTMHRVGRFLRRRRVPLAGAVVALVVGLVAWQRVRASYTSAFLDAAWAPDRNSSNGGVTGRVTNWNGSPAGDLAVVAEDDGGTHGAKTDAHGEFSVNADGRHLRRFGVVGIDSIPLTEFNRRGDHGLTFDIHLKRPAAPWRGPL